MSDIQNEMGKMNTEQEITGTPNSIPEMEGVKTFDEKVAEFDEEMAKDSGQDLQDVIKMSKKELDGVIQGIVKRYDEQLAAAMDMNEKLKLTLAMQSEKLEAVGKMTASRAKLKVLNVDHGPPDHQQSLVKLHEDKLKGKAHRFVNTRADLRSLRRAQGYDPVLDGEGNEVRYMDGVLMTMSQEKFDRTIKAPKDARKAFRREGIVERFKETGQKHGVETYGDITYDKVEEGVTPNGEHSSG